MSARGISRVGLHGGPDGEELGYVAAPLLELHLQPHPDDAVGPEDAGFGLHPVHRELAGVIHRLGQHVEPWFFDQRPSCSPTW